MNKPVDTSAAAVQREIRSLGCAKDNGNGVVVDIVAEDCQAAASLIEALSAERDLLASRILACAVDEYNATFSPSPLRASSEERLAARCAVRGLMVRLGLYGEFCTLTAEQPVMAVQSDVVGFRSDGSPISPYAPGGGPLLGGSSA